MISIDGIEYHYTEGLKLIEDEKTLDKLIKRVENFAIHKFAEFALIPYI